LAITAYFREFASGIPLRFVLRYACIKSGEQWAVRELRLRVSIPPNVEFVGKTIHDS